jgi:hypothetical protein
MVRAAMTRNLAQRAGLLAALAVLAGCSSPPPAQHPTPQKPTKIVTPDAKPAADAGPPMFAATPIDDLDEADGPHYFARGKDGAMLVVARNGRFFARAAALDGTPKGAAATDIGAAPAAAELLVGTLQPLGDGFVLAWAEKDGDRVKLAAVTVDAAAAVRKARATITEMTEEPGFLQVVPREAGALIAWELPHGSTMDVTAVALDAQGAATGAATTLLSGVLGWDPAPSGGALVAVMPGPQKDGDADPGTVASGKVVLVPLDAAGKPTKQIEVSAPLSAQPDLAVSEIGGRLVLAWTDTRDIDAAVWTAAVDKNGTLAVPPKRATPPTGEQALVTITGTEAFAPPVPRGLLAWEDVLGAPPGSPKIHLATLGPDASIGKERATLDFQAEGPPDLSADQSGFGAVTLAPASQGASPVEGAPVWPTFVRFGPDLSVLSAEPVRAALFGDAGVPYLVHGLHCKDGACTTLGTAARTPSKVALVSLVSRKTDWLPPAHREPDDAPPRATALSAVYNGDQIARATAAEIPGGGTLAAWITYFAEGEPTARAKKNGSAEVAILPVPAGGKRPDKAAPISLSKKAVSVGGVAVSAAPADKGDKKEIAVAWVAREKGEAQVYVTKVDETGKKLAQKKLTVIPRLKKGATPSEASDVAISWTTAEGGEGWIVSWVDTRDGNAEVYAAKIDRSLNKIGPDRRLTDAAGDASEVHLLSRGKDTFVAWADARDKAEDGRADIYVTRIDNRSLAKAAPEARLAATPGNSRSPQLVAAPGGAVWAVWIEDPADGSDAGGGSVRFAVLDEKGAAVTTTTLPAPLKSTAVSAALTCTDKTCRAVVARGTAEALYLDALDVTALAQPGKQKTLLTLPGLGNADISPVFADRTGGALFFAADAASGLGRVRRLDIDW